MDLDEQPNTTQWIPNGAIENALEHSFKDRWYAYFVEAWEIRRMHLTVTARALWRRSQALMRQSSRPSSSRRKHNILRQEMPLQYLDGLYEYARILTCNDTDAEDLVRKCFLRVAKIRRRMRPNSDLQLMLFTILRDAFRKQVRNVGKKYGRGENWNEPITSYATKFRSTDIRNVIGLLPEEDRELIVLRDFQAFSYQQIARLLNRPTDTVASRLFHARNKLSQLLTSV
jgi:RNA polymerase sigma-70 factor, ECF subfamily